MSANYRARWGFPPLCHDVTPMDSMWHRLSSAESRGCGRPAYAARSRHSRRRSPPLSAGGSQVAALTTCSPGKLLGAEFMKDPFTRSSRRGFEPRLTGAVPLNRRPMKPEPGERASGAVALLFARAPLGRLGANREGEKRLPRKSVLFRVALRPDVGAASSR